MRRKNKNKSVDGEREKEFDNPVADARGSLSSDPATPTVATFEMEDGSLAGSARAERRALSVDIPDGGGDSPGPEESPVETPTEQLVGLSSEDTSVDVDFDLGERREGRRKLHFLVFMLATLVLLPVYSLWFAFMAWVYYLVPNMIAMVGLIVSFFLPAVLYLGWRAARERNSGLLQFYAFLLVLAVSVQVSVCVVLVLDDGVIRNGYIQSVTIAGRDACESTDSLPWGADYLPIDATCACFSVQKDQESRLARLESPGGNLTGALLVDDKTARQETRANSSAVSPAGVSMNMTLCHTVAATNETVCEVVESLVDCLGFVVDTRIGLTGPHVIAICVGTLCAELFLSFLAYTMMDDLDYKEQQQASKRKGGLTVGTLRGAIVDAEGLKSGQDDKSSNSFGCRYAVLTLRSEDVAEKEHRVYTAVTGKVEDDPSPDWNQPFEGWVLYECSEFLEIEVYDVIVAKRKKTKEVLIGSAKVKIEGDRLPQLDYTMNGDEEEGPCSINLKWKPLGKKKKDLPEVQPAGTINIMLHRVPVPPPLTRRSVSITQTWYFESTVLFMVFLSMVALALQSPAVPPPPDTYAALRILEIFVATHMAVELLLEMQPLVAAGKLHTCIFQGWWQLHVFVLVCNWASIMMPAVTMATDGNNIASDVMGQDVASKLEKLFSVGRVLRIVRPLRTLRMIDNVEMIIRTLQESLHLFGTVCLLLLFLMSILTLVGTSSFAGALQYTCVGDPGEDSTRPKCSEDQLARANEMGVDCPVQCPPSLAAVGGRCESYVYCAPLPAPREIGADSFGFRDFDDFIRGLLTVIVQTTGDGGMHTMPLALHDAGVADGASNRAWLMSFCTSVLMNLLALNLFLAVCCAAYSDVSSRSEEIAEQKQKLLDQMREEELRTETPEQKLVREAKEAADAERRRPLDERLADKVWVPKNQDNFSDPPESDSEIYSESKVSRSRCSRVRNMSKRIVLSGTFETLSSLVIIGNTVTMALSSEGMDEELKKTLVIFEIVFLVCYLMEAVLKFLAGGWKIYIESKANRFDLFVIVASLLGFFATFFQEEVKAMLGGSADDQMGSMQSLRAVRLLRALQVVRLLNRSKSLLTILRTIFQAWKPIVIHSFFSLFSMCMYAIIGMHLFGGSLGPGVDIAEYNRQLNTHYETFGNGLLTTFEMTVGEDWAESMYWYMQNAAEGYGYPQWVVALYFISMYLWMNCILFSLYVAMLLENFSVPEPDKMPTQKRMYERQQRKMMRDMANVSVSVLEVTVEQDLAKGYTQTVESSVVQEFLTYSDGLSAETRNAAHNKSLYLFAVDNALRLRCAKIQQSPWFSKMISNLIIFSCASLAAEGRGDSVELVAAAADAKQQLGDTDADADTIDINMDPMAYMPTTFLGKDIYFWINLCVLGAFFSECLLKIIIHGFVFRSGPTVPYMHHRLNILDFFIISLCLIAYVPGGPVAGQWARALRLGRIITPLINLTKNPDISLVLISFVRAIPDTAVVMLPLVLMGVVFAIIGVAWFGGVLKRCIETANPLETLEQYQNETECLAMNDFVAAQNLTGSYEWSSPSFNFDSSPNSMATLFISLTDGTHNFMIRTAGDDTGLKGYWVAFHITFTCFFLNLFLGVLSASFEKSSGLAVRTIGEKQWKGTRHMLLAYNTGETGEEALRPIAAAKCCGQATPRFWFKLRTFFFLVSTDDRAEMFWRGVIVGNTITLATDKYPTLPGHLLVVAHLNTLFLCLCALEVTIKLIGFGPKAFFKNGWLVSDSILVGVSLYYRLSGDTSGVEALRVMRVFRIVVLGSKIPVLVALIDVLIKCIRASFGVIMITSLVVYLYSIIGMNLFGALPTDERLEELGISVLQAAILRLEGRVQGVACPSCEYYTDYSNFNDFTSSFKLLMQIVFGQELEPFITDLQFLGANFVVAFTFFASFYIGTVWVCVNLLIVTVLSNFDAEQSGTIQEDEILPVDMDGFAHTWAALTIGVHSAPSVKRKSEGILTRIKDGVKESIQQLEGHETAPDNETPFDPDVVFEDGDALLCGQLTVRIEQLDGLQPFRRPYCNVVAHGRYSTSAETRQTRTVPTKEGVASWSKTVNRGKKNERMEDGESLVFHATEFHTHLTIEVWDTHKFCNEDIGVVTLSFHDLREMVDEKTLTVDLLERHTQQNTYYVHGNKSRWDKHELNVGRPPEDEYDPQAIAIAAAADAAAATKAEQARLLAEAKLAEQASASTEELAGNDEEAPEEEMAVPKSQDKKAKKRHDDAVKHARKQQKKAEKEKKKKEEKKQRKKKKKQDKKKQDDTEENDGEVDSDEVPHVSNLQLQGISQQAKIVVEDGIEWIDPFGNCQPNGRRLRLTIEFVPGLFEVPNEAFLAEHYVRFSRMEQSCGIHGWLDVSENGGAWKRRYCYMQDIPIPALKFYRNAANIGELEKLSKEKKEEIHAFPGDRIMNIVGAQGKGRKQIRNRVFSIGVDEDIPNGKQVETHVGKISGTIVQAMYLKQIETKGVRLVERVEFEEEAKLDEHEEDDDDDDDDGDDDGGASDDVVAVRPDAGSASPRASPRTPRTPRMALGVLGVLSGNASPRRSINAEVEIEPTRYMAAKRAALRAEADMKSEKVGVLMRKQVVVVLATRYIGDVLRLKTEQGWCSATSVDGRNTLMIAENSRTAHYRVKKQCEIGRFVQLSNCLAGGIGHLEVGQVVEVLESKEDPETSALRHRIVPVDELGEAWISDVDIDATATPDPYCVVETFNQPRGKELTKLSKYKQPKPDFVQTAAVEDNLTPVWEHNFVLGIVPSTRKILVHVHNDSASHVMGKAELELMSSSLVSDIPGPVLRGSCIDGGEIRLGEEATDVKVQLVTPMGKKGQGGDPAGTVVLRLAYNEIVSEAQMLEKRAERGGDLVAGMLTSEKKRVKWSFKASTNTEARSWLAAMRWLGDGFLRYAPKYLEIPPKPLVQTELERVRHNLELLDLPFTRVNQLLQGLYKRKVMGKRKPTLRRMVYAVFQLELHAWSANLEQQHKKHAKRKADVQGEYLEDLRGLHFEQVLERLSIIHYGKHRCLSYAVQMDEYHMEVNHISLQILQTCISMWLFKRRMGRTVGGYTWPSNPVWAKMPEAFKMAIEGIATTRMRSLVILRGEVERRSRPALIDVQLPKKQRLTDKMVGTDGDGQGKRRFLSCKKISHDGQQEVESTDVEAGATRVQTQESADERQAYAAILSRLTPAQINEVFDAVDSNGGGELSPDELRDAITRLTGNEIGGATLARLAAFLDTDRNGSVDRSEFVQGIKKFAQLQKAGALDEDTDSDLDELEATPEELKKALVRPINE